MEDLNSLSKSWRTASLDDGFSWADVVEEEMSKSCHAVMTTKHNIHDKWRLEGLEIIDNANLTPLAYKICREIFLWSVCNEKTGKRNPKEHFPKFECREDQKFSQALIESIDEGQWQKNGDTEKKYGDGGCYGQHKHACTGRNCPYCDGDGQIIHACNLCAKKHKSCKKCRNGYINVTKTAKLCPSIRPNRRCSRCRGKGFYPKDCTGTCPMRQYASKHNGVLQASCVCGRPHRLGDCKHIDNGRGFRTISPYQGIDKCDNCGYMHPIIYMLSNPRKKAVRRVRKINKANKDGWNVV